jgi:hypothetical protein
MTEKLRSRVTGKVREAIQQSVARILVGVDGTVTLETKPDGLLGVKAIHVRLDGEEEGGLIHQSFLSSSAAWPESSGPLVLRISSATASFRCCSGVRPTKARPLW